MQIGYSKIARILSPAEMSSERKTHIGVLFRFPDSMNLQTEPPKNHNGIAERVLRVL